MKKINYKGRCEKRKVSKCKDVCRTYTKIQSAFVDLLEKDTRLNYLRWHKDLDYRERTGRVRTLIETRVQFLHDFFTNPDSFHRLIFHFGWGHFSYYVKDGESMGFLPTHEYGENQSTHYEEKHGFITGWKDTESGQLLQAEEPINKDRDFRPVYAP